MNVLIDSRKLHSGMHVIVYHLVIDSMCHIPSVSYIPYQIDGRMGVASFRLLQAVCEIIIVSAMDDHNRQGHTLSASFSPHTLCLWQTSRNGHMPFFQKPGDCQATLHHFGTKLMHLYHSVEHCWNISYRASTVKGDMSMGISWTDQEPLGGCHPYFASWKCEKYTVRSHSWIDSDHSIRQKELLRIFRNPGIVPDIQVKWARVHKINRCLCTRFTILS